MPLAVNRERLWSSVQSLAEVGRYLDERTGLHGVNRLALTDADAEGRRLVRSWFEQAGLEVRTDRVGNTYGRRAGRGAPDLAPVLVGSHIDSVPTGGAFDGALGVLSGLEVVRVLDEHGVATERPLEVAFFSEEEGARFGTDMLGSAVAVGRIPLERALSLTDKEGKRFGDELARIGFAGVVEPRLAPPHAYLEVHVEQGPVLWAAGLDVGLVTGVQAISWQELTLHGKSAHAGTTPMELRKDAGLAAARLACHLADMCASGEYGPHMRATMGRVDPVPGLVNIVAGRVVCTVDLRNPDDEAMARSERDLAAWLGELSERMGVTVEARQTARTPHVPFADDVMAILEGSIKEHGYSYQRLISGAGHDAQELASLCPTGMVFVPGEHEGISHNPREYSTPEACERGAQVLLDAVLTLCGTT